MHDWSGDISNSNLNIITNIWTNKYGFFSSNTFLSFGYFGASFVKSSDTYDWHVQYNACWWSPMIKSCDFNLRAIQLTEYAFCVTLNYYQNKYC